MRLWDNLEARKPDRKPKDWTKSSQAEHAAGRERAGLSWSAGVKSEGVRDYIWLKLPEDGSSNE